MSSNNEFYKKFAFIFLGIISVLIVAKFTVLAPNEKVYLKEKDNSSFREAKEIITWQEAGKYYGSYVSVEGKIVRSHNSGKACFLNFHPDYKRYFTAVIFKSAFSKFPPEPENFYLNKKVRVIGTVKEYEGSPEIILNSPSQIEILE